MVCVTPVLSHAFLSSSFPLHAPPPTQEVLHACANSVPLVSPQVRYVSSLMLPMWKKFVVSFSTGKQVDANVIKGKKIIIVVITEIQRVTRRERKGTSNLLDRPLSRVLLH